MRTYYLQYQIKPIPYPRGAVRCHLSKESKDALPRQAPGSMPGRNIGEAVEKMEYWASKMLTRQNGFTCRAVLEESPKGIVK